MKTDAAHTPAAMAAGHYAEWFDRCSVGRCGPDARSYFTAKGRALAELFLNRVGDPGLRDDLLDPAVPARPWLLFEAFMAVPKRNGTRYKDWLRAVAGKGGSAIPVPVLNKNVALCFRTVIRQWVCREGVHSRNADGHVVARHRSESQSAGPGESAPAFCLEAIPSAVPDASDVVVLRDLREKAARLAAEFVGALSPAMRLAMMAAAAGLSLADPGLARAAGLRKSALYDGLKRVREAAMAAVRRHYPKEPPDGVMALSAMLCRESLAECERRMKAPEKERFGRLVEGKGESQ